MCTIFKYMHTCIMDSGPDSPICSRYPHPLGTQAGSGAVHTRKGLQMPPINGASTLRLRSGLKPKNSPRPVKTTQLPAYLDPNSMQNTGPSGLQVYKQYLLCGLKYLNMTYFGLFGAPGLDHLSSSRTILSHTFSIPPVPQNRSDRKQPIVMSRWLLGIL